MKVLLVNMSIDVVRGGGTAERTLQLARHMQKAGVECSILTTNIGMSSESLRNLRAEGLNISALPCIIPRFYFPSLSFGKITKLVKEADIIHLMGHWIFINVMTFTVATILRKPYVVCPAGSLPLFGRSKLLKEAFNFLIGNRIVTNADRCIAIAENEVAQFAAYGVSRNKITLIPNGVNPNDFTMLPNDFWSRLKINNHKYILFMGRLNLIKGPDLLLDAFLQISSKYPDIHLIFAGPDDGMLTELINKAQELSDVRVHFIGYLGGAEKTAAYRGAELLVIPSRLEAMSIVALEAGICGTPVLLTDQCGFNELEAVGGGKVVPASVEGIKNGLCELLPNVKKRYAMGKAIKKYVIDNFTWENTANKHLQLFESIISYRKLEA